MPADLAPLTDSQIMRTTLLLIAATLVLLLSGPGTRSASAAPNIGPPNASPSAGPFEVFTMADVVAGPVGPLVDTTVVVENNSELPSTVFLIGEFVWPNGTRRTVIYGPPETIPADGAILINALNLVPPGVGSGTSTFSATAFVTTVGSTGHSLYRRRLIASDSSSFELP
jgi:hypothetical protein